MRKLALVSFATGGTVTTQTPFQISRLPNSSNYTNNCPVNNDTIRTYSAVCGNGTLWGIVPQQNAASTPSNAWGSYAPYQMARGSLLLTHPTGTTTDLYIAFGTGGGELLAANSTCGANCAYTGVLFGYSVGYYGVAPYVRFSALTSSPFFATCATNSIGCVTSGLFPSVNTAYNTSSAPTGPNCYTPSVSMTSCDQGDNWFNGGGI